MDYGVAEVFKIVVKNVWLLSADSELTRSISMVSKPFIFEVFGVK